MDADGFRAYLKRKGKDGPIADALIMAVGTFETFLYQTKKKPLEETAPSDIKAFSKAVETRRKGESKPLMLAVALYFAFWGLKDLALVAASLKEK